MIYGIPIGQVGLVGTLLGFVLALLMMLFKGTLVTRREADAKDVEIARLWEANAEQAKQIRMLSEVGRTVEQTARGLQQEMRSP